MFQVEYAVHLQYTARAMTFVRNELVPFAPFVGLDVLDDTLGEFKLEHITWHQTPPRFQCQSTIIRRDWTLPQACRAMRKAGWVVDKEAKRPKMRRRDDK